MARTISFHLDENVSRAIAIGLRRHGIDVTTTPEAGLLGAIDEEQVAHACSCGRVIFTQDRDFLRIHAMGTPHPGIAYCEKDTRTIGQIVLGLVDIWEILDPEEMADHVEYLYTSRNGTNGTVFGHALATRLPVPAANPIFTAATWSSAGSDRIYSIYPHDGEHNAGPGRD